MGLIVVHVVVPDIPHIQSECGEHPRILCGILSLPHNIVKDVEFYYELPILFVDVSRIDFKGVN